MDSEQIQQQMRMRRAAIDAKLDALQAAMRTARRRSAAALLITVSASLLAIFLVRRRAPRQNARRPQGALRLARSG